MSYVPQYPDNMPCPTWEYSFSRTDFRRETRFTSGWVRKRNQFPETGGRVNLTFTMDTATYASWANWMKANGWNWFIINLEPGIGAPTGPQEVRLTTEISTTYGDFDQITATAGGEFHAN